MNGFKGTLAEACVNLGKLKHEAGEDKQARIFFERGCELSLQLLADNPDVTQTQVILAESHAGLSRVASARGQRKEAERSLANARQAWEKLVTEHPDIPRFSTGLKNLEAQLHQ